VTKCQTGNIRARECAFTRSNLLTSLRMFHPFTHQIFFVAMKTHHYFCDHDSSRVHSILVSRHDFQNLFLLHTTFRPNLWPTQPPNQRIPGTLSLVLKRPGREADHSPPSSVKMNAWSYTSSPWVLVHGVVLS